MNIDDCWKLISDSGIGGSLSRRKENLFDCLNGINKDEVIEFGTYTLIRERIAYNVAKHYAAGRILSGGFLSDDDAEYYRRWLIIKGKEIYMTALLSPDDLADIDLFVDDQEYPAFEELVQIITETYANLKFSSIEDDIFDDAYDEFWDLCDERVISSDFMDKQVFLDAFTYAG